MTTKPTQPAPVPPVPTPVPSRTDRAAFAARGDAMMAWFPGGVDGINASVDFINTAGDFAQEQVEASIASSNFRGDWGSLSGPLTRPASVRHNSRIWLLLADLANVAADEPTPSNSNWAVLEIGPNPDMRNRITNGGCRIAQEGPTSVTAGIYTYGGADRICASVNGSGVTGTIAQLTTGPSIGVLGFSQAVSNLSTSSSGIVLFQARMEAKEVRDLNGKQTTVSCRVYQDTGATISTAALQVARPTSTPDTFSAQTLLQASGNQTVPSGVLTKLVWTLTLGAADANFGLSATCAFPFASALTSKNFAITDWQLEIGGVETPLEVMPFAVEELRCKRTLECFPIGSIDYIGNNGQSGQNNSVALPMKVAKRAAPTAVSGSYTPVNASTATLALGVADNVVLNVFSTAAGQWRITNSSIVKIRCDL